MHCFQSHQRRQRLAACLIRRRQLRSGTRFEASVRTKIVPGFLLTSHTVHAEEIGRPGTCKASVSCAGTNVYSCSAGKERSFAGFHAAGVRLTCAAPQQWHWPLAAVVCKGDYAVSGTPQIPVTSGQADCEANSVLRAGRGSARHVQHRLLQAELRRRRACSPVSCVLFSCCFRVSNQHLSESSRAFGRQTLNPLSPLTRSSASAFSSARSRARLSCCCWPLVRPLGPVHFSE